MHAGAGGVLRRRRLHRAQVRLQRTQPRADAGLRNSHILLRRWNIKKQTAHHAADFVLVLAAVAFEDAEHCRDMVFHFCNDQAAASTALSCWRWIFLLLHGYLDAVIVDLSVQNYSIVTES